MTELACLDGHILPLADARIAVLDRGFLFADGVYEVTAVLAGRPVDLDAHLARLARSAGALGIDLPEGVAALHHRLIAEARLVEGLIYLQLTRGADDHRNFLPSPGTPPTLLLFTQTRPLTGTKAQREGLAIATLPDLRWARRDIKSVMLLAQVLAKREAAARGADDAWLVDADGFVTEGASATAYIVAEDRIVTRPNSIAILPGCTRLAVERLAAEQGLTIEQRGFTVAEAQAAREAFVSAAASLIAPVVRIDDAPVGDGRPGSIARRLLELYLRAASA